MNPKPAFDYRDLLGQHWDIHLDPDSSRRLVIGAAASRQGLAVVALCEGKIASPKLESYAHVVIGPIEDDWEYIALLIGQLRAILEPPVISKVYLRVDPHSAEDVSTRIYNRLRSTFPTQMVLVEDSRITAWCRKASCTVRLPDIPTEDVWTRDLLRSAAQTVLYAELCLELAPRQEVLAASVPLGGQLARSYFRQRHEREAKDRGISGSGSKGGSK